MLKQTWWPERACTLFTKKIGGMEDFYSEEDFDAILAAIEDNLLEENKEFSPVDLLVEEVEHHHPATVFSCDECDKVCKTSRGLTPTQRCHPQGSSMWTICLWKATSDT